MWELTNDTHNVLDAWLARMVQAATKAAGISIPIGWKEAMAMRGIHVTDVHPAPRSIGNEAGALTARLARNFGAGWSFPATTAARESCGCSERSAGPAAQEDPRPPCWPQTVYTYLEARPARISQLDFELDAALALASGFGLPAQLTAALEMDTVFITPDASTELEGIVLNVRGRDEGRKVLRRRAVADTHPCAWTASAAATLRTRIGFIAWYRRRLAVPDSRYVFPRVDADGTLQEDRHLDPSVLNRHIKTVQPDAQWHDLRRGLENALELVHYENASPSVQEHVKNTLSLRSNRPLRGSRESYVRNVITDLFGATRNLHKVAPSAVGAMLGGPDVAAAQADFDTECRRCQRNLPIGTPGALCDAPGCEWTLCIACHPDNSELLCPKHDRATRGSGRSKPLLKPDRT
jgi:hypothetical protein